MTTLCSSCRAPIIWAKTVNGKPMPLDAAPDPAGIVFLENGIAIVLSGIEPGLTTRPGVMRHNSHFVSCPSAARHRKR